MNKQFDIKLTTRFKKQLKVLRQQPNFNYDELDKVINMLSNAKRFRSCRYLQFQAININPRMLDI